MTVTVVVGSQWGDEAKGKIVDLLAGEADIVARFNGGDNAGHTVINPAGTFKLRLTPNGFSNPQAACVIGPGVVVNMETLIGELRNLEEHGMDLTGRLWVSPRCHLVMPYHPLLEEIYENAKGAGRTGTTKRGMGPVYADKAGYNGIRLFDLAEPDVFAQKLRIQLSVKNRILDAFDLPPLDFQQVYHEKLEQYARVCGVVREPFGMLQEALRRGSNIVLEGAQAALLDNTWGTYPFCTASNTISGGATTGLGIPPSRLERIIGVTKAYTTRVGAGPMPTELLDANGSALREAGREYGTVTGRARRCGWLDAALVRFSSQLNGCTELALTKLDVLDSLAEVKICLGYRLPGEAEGADLHEYWEGDSRWLGEVVPVYEVLPGWQESTRRVRNWEDLPSQAQAYVRRVEAITGTEVKIVSVGPGREEFLRVAE